jgi:hypothetical protein
MKLLSVLKNLILEARELLGNYDFDGQDVDLLYNTHSGIGVSTSIYGRQPIELVQTSMVDFLDVIVPTSLDILNKPSRSTGKDHSILVKDYMNGMDYHFWVNKIKNDKLFLTINTSIGHPKFLPNKQNDATIIITKSGDTIIREQFENNNFTKIVRGDIIIYIN